MVPPDPGERMGKYLVVLGLERVRRKGLKRELNITFHRCRTIVTSNGVLSYSMCNVKCCTTLHNLIVIIISYHDIPDTMTSYISRSAALYDINQVINLH